jgi:arabinogalactan endo-1,4-beta-galactosidase
MSGLTRRDLGTAAGATLVVGLAGCATMPQPGATAPKSARPWPYLIGADVSWIPEDEALGATYYENGVQRDPFEILKGAGFNAVKARLFVDPARGYSKEKPGGPWCDMAQMVKFARRIRDAGMHTSVTIHYSDWSMPSTRMAQMR